MENKNVVELVDYSKWNIYKKMLHVENELGFVKKKLDVEMGRGSYKAVGEVDVLEAVKPIEFKYGIKSLPILRAIVESKETQTKTGTINQFMRVETTYRFINVDDPKDYVDVITYGDGVDSQDKASGKAMTYADKYALLKSYKIATGDDPDQKASEEQKTITKEQKYNKSTTHASAKQIELLLGLLNNSEAGIRYTKEQYQVESLDKLTVEQASEVIAKIRAKQGK